MTARVASLGDSTSCGEGVGLAVPPAQTWPALLSAAVPGGALTPLARAGAKVRALREEQLPVALAAEPHLATVLIGLNDVSRGGFDDREVRTDLLTVVRALRRRGATVLVGRLHDPTRHLPLPGSLRELVRGRVAAVNAAVDAAAREATPGNGGDVLVLDLDRIPGLRLRSAWAVDRVHPSTAAHGLMASAAAAVLRGAGWPVERRLPRPLPTSAPGRAAEAWWVGRHGLPWLAGHAREVVLPALSAAR